jgi:hypothetical protein
LFTSNAKGTFMGMCESLVLRRRPGFLYSIIEYE